MYIKRFFFLWVLLCITKIAFCKVDSSFTKKDSVRNIAKSDTVNNIKDSIAKAILDSNKKMETQFEQPYSILKNYPLFTSQQAEYMIIKFKTKTNKDLLFYVLLSCVLFFAIVKLIFPKYVKNIFSILFQTSFRQSQTREQLLQDNVASLLFNFLFIICFGFFISLIIEKNNWITLNFFALFGYACLTLLIIYLFKLIFTRFLGYIFNVNQAATSYSFIVFIVNKIAGILLLPIIFFIAFSNPPVVHLFTNIAFSLIGFLLITRLYMTYKNTSTLLKINPIHFFLYFCSIEILPLLVLYKYCSKHVSSGI
jgi:hypothetical protein